MELLEVKHMVDMNQNFSSSLSGRKVPVYATEQGTVCVKFFTLLEG